MTKVPAISGRGSERIELFRVDQQYKTLRTALRCIAAVGAVYYLKDVLDVLAGQTTKLALELSVLADFKVAVLLSLAGATTLWAVAERMIRYRKVESLQGRVREL